MRRPYLVAPFGQMGLTGGFIGRHGNGGVEAKPGHHTLDGVEPGGEAQFAEKSSDNERAKEFDFIQMVGDGEISGVQGSLDAGFERR